MMDEEAIILSKHEATDNNICFRFNILKSIAQNTATIYISQSAERKEKLRTIRDSESRIKYSIAHEARMIYFSLCVSL
jgi:hypothetical protein